MAKPKKLSENTIAVNRKATHDYFIEQKYQAGIVLQGWEVKSLRAGKAQLKESYVVVRHGEIWLIGCHISALETASTHIKPDATRSRKLLLQRDEINKLVGLSERKGYTLVPLSLYWVKNKIKLSIGLAKGKKEHDKRDSDKQRDWQRQQQKLLKIKN